MLPQAPPAHARKTAEGCLPQRHQSQSECSQPRDLLPLQPSAGVPVAQLGVTACECKDWGQNSIIFLRNQIAPREKTLRCISRDRAALCKMQKQINKLTCFANAPILVAAWEWMAQRARSRSDEGNLGVATAPPPFRPIRSAAPGETSGAARMGSSPRFY